MKNTFIVLSLLLSSLGAMACDVCGGASMNTGFGYIPLQKRHIVGLNHNYSLFNTDHPAMPNMEAMHSKDHFNTIDLWARYFISPRIMATLNVPYRINTLDFGNRTLSNNGLGDISASVYGVVYRKGSINSSFQAMWLLGLGVKAPTGSSDKIIEDVSVQNLQNGSGSWDGIAGSNLSLRFGDYGLNHEISFNYNTPNSADFKFGNRLGSRLIGFYQLPKGKGTYVPQLGLNFINYNKDLIWAERGIKKTYSGREQLNAQVGMDYYRKQLGLRFSTEIPLYAHIAEGVVTPVVTTNFQILYFINNK